MDAKFKVYVHHLLGCKLSQESAYLKVIVHKTTLVHASHHTKHKRIMDDRKQKWVVLEELVELQLNLKFIKFDESIDGEE